MASRSTIGILNNDNTITEIYCHWDGYIAHNGYILNRFYKTEKQVRALINGGAINNLGITPERISDKQHEEELKNCSMELKKVSQKPCYDPNYDYIFNKFSENKNYKRYYVKTVGMYSEDEELKPYSYTYREDFGSEEYSYLFNPKTKQWKVCIHGVRFGDKYINKTYLLDVLFNKYFVFDGWLSASQCNENGFSRGGFDTLKNKWVASVFPKGKKEEKFENISHRKVDMWLRQKQLEYGLN